MKKDEKRKEEKKEPKEKKKRKEASAKGPSKMANFGANMMPFNWQMSQPMGYQQMAAPQGFYPQSQPSMGPRPEWRACLNCKQTGHLARNCPFRPAPSAALGAAPK